MLLIPKIDSTLNERQPYPKKKKKGPSFEKNKTKGGREGAVENLWLIWTKSVKVGHATWDPAKQAGRPGHVVTWQGAPGGCFVFFFLWGGAAGVVQNCGGVNHLIGHEIVGTVP